MTTFPMSHTTLSALEPLVDTRRLHERVGRASAEIQDAFTTYVAEALFFRRILQTCITDLEPGSRVVEIGSGIGLLARLIAAEGYAVTAFEPESAGFGHMQAISNMLEECWLGEHRDVTFMREQFDGPAVTSLSPSLIIAVNVIEHVPAPANLIIAATNSLSPLGTARFICPNYAFPYEPHFNMLTAVNKQLTYRLARRKIGRSSIPDTEQFWNDLSWPTVRTLRRSLIAAGTTHRFSRSALLGYVARLDDLEFLSRKGALFGFLSRSVRPIVRGGARIMPLAAAPIIDLTTRPTHSLPSRPATS